MPDGLILVTGATGAVGPSVVRACLAAGHTVRTFSIEAPPGDLFPPGVDARVGDVCDADAVRAAVSGADAVVHLAALLHQFQATPELDRQFERVNVHGTENVVNAAVQAGVRRVVCLSTIAVYGASAGHVLDERDRLKPDSTYARTKVAAEAAVLSARSSGRPVGTVLRPAAVYGSRVKGNYRRLAEAIARRRFVRVGAGLNRRTLVHDSDLARAVVLAADHPAAAGAVFNVTDGAVHTLEQIISAIYRALGRKPPRLHVPLGPALIAAGVCERACRALGIDPPVTRSLLDKYTEDVAVDGRLIATTLGFRPLVDLEAGWLEALGRSESRVGGEDAHGLQGIYNRDRR
jgi:nucleoside-diphosphate-sugar epimerase